MILFIKKPSVTNGLIHNYPFRGSLENVVDPSLPATNFGTVF